MKRVVSLCLAALLTMTLTAAADTPRKDDVPKLIKNLKSKDAKTRTAAAEDIAKVGQIRSADAQPAIEPLIEAMKDKDTNVRSAATLALGEIDPDPKIAVPALTEALKDKEAKVRTAAATALGLMGPDAKDGLSALQELRGKEKERGVNRAVTMAIRRINEKPGKK